MHDITNKKHSTANKLNCPRNCTLPILCLTNIDYITTHTQRFISSSTNKI